MICLKLMVLKVLKKRVLLFPCGRFQTGNINFSIVPLFDKNRQTNEKYIENADKCTFDCSYSRTLTNNGVYTCPLLTSDERGRSGSSFEDYSKRNFLETEICSQCAKNGKNLFLNSWI